VDVATLACRTEADVAAFTTTQGGSCAGGNYAAPDNGDRIATAVDNPAGMLLLAIDLDRGAVRPVLQWYAFSHPLVCPGDPDLITFVPADNACWKMDWPQHLRTRTWAVRVSDGMPRRFITPPGRTSTHESWSSDGKRMIYFEKAGGAWTPVRIRSVSRLGDDVRTHFESDQYRLGHGALSPDQRYFVSDVQNAHDSPLLLIDMQTGRREILCWPDASNDGGHAACAHVHPSFSPRGRYVAFTSDKTGLAQVYILPLTS
jgi:Tol biopolymer transport system component